MNNHHTHPIYKYVQRCEIPPIYVQRCETITVSSLEVQRVIVEHVETLELSLLSCIVHGGGPKVILFQSSGQ